uniref:Secreted protein n=1 Tax=Streptomyces sp. NBC_01401 TaxID=2903854 RepID=A0AAU3GZH1_9ACTN
MRTRKISVLTMTAVALGLALTACGNDGGESAPTTASSSSAAVGTSKSEAKSEAASEATEGKSSGTPAKSGTKCTDQIDYAGDSRSNAEINSIGADTGTCPPVQKK